VLDLGGFRYAEEPLVVALSVLDDLWTRREQRRPVLIVIDEAHNLCSPDLDSPLGRAVREQIIRIAAEGRKYGLWLLLSTQRPSKVHQGIISQCDNLALMKMSSPIDLHELASIFGFVPESLIEQSPLFTQGMALFAGELTASYNRIMAIAVFGAVPLVLLFLLLQKNFVRGIVLTGLKEG